MEKKMKVGDRVKTKCNSNCVMQINTGVVIKVIDDIDCADVVTYMVRFDSVCVGCHVDYPNCYFTEEEIELVQWRAR